MKNREICLVRGIFGYSLSKLIMYHNYNYSLLIIICSYMLRRREVSKRDWRMAKNYRSELYIRISAKIIVYM